MIDIQKIKLDPRVSAALDKYAQAIKDWGIKDNTPHKLMQAEDDLIDAVAKMVKK